LAGGAKTGTANTLVAREGRAIRITIAPIRSSFDRVWWAIRYGCGSQASRDSCDAWAALHALQRNKIPATCDKCRGFPLRVSFLRACPARLRPMRETVFEFGLVPRVGWLWFHSSTRRPSLHLRFMIFTTLPIVAPSRDARVACFISRPIPILPAQIPDAFCRATCSGIPFVA
jgi:hypothetical protein